jgi:hypothetical protein
MSQDHFLSKIYESVLNKTAASSNKPQNLKQAYYRVILEQINEDTDVLMQNRDAEDKPTGDVEEFKISDQLAKQIKSNIKKEIGFAATGDKTNLNEIIKKVLILGNWGKVADLNFLIEGVGGVFNKEELVVDNIVKYPQFLESSKNLLEEKLMNNPSSKVNLKDLIPDWFNSFFESKDGLGVVEALWNIVPNTKPSSGRGELALTIISPSKKASAGDLLVGDVPVEMKGSYGTMGGDNHIINTSKELQQIFNEDIGTVSMANRKQNVIFRLQKEISSKHEQFKKNILQQVENDTPPEEIKKIIDQGPLSDAGKLKIYTILVAGLTIPKFNYRDSLLAFFSKYELLSDEQLATGVFAARNYSEVSSPESVKNKIKNIITKEKDALFQKHHERQFTYTLQALIGALHVCAYQEVYQFKGIIFVNDSSKDMIYLKFNRDTISENLDNVYSFIKQTKPVINLSMTQIQKAAGFNFLAQN